MIKKLNVLRVGERQEEEEFVCYSHFLLYKRNFAIVMSTRWRRLGTRPNRNHLTFFSRVINEAHVNCEIAKLILAAALAKRLFRYLKLKSFSRLRHSVDSVHLKMDAVFLPCDGRSV